MSTKYFHFVGGATGAVKGFTYPEGAPVDVVVFKQPMAAVQGWHNIGAGARTAIINRFVAAGWIEGEQSKPD